MIAVVTDSTSDLPPEQARSLGITVLPLQVLLNDRTLLDWQEIDPDAVYQHQEAGGGVATSPPAVDTFAALYTELLGTYERILSIHISSRLSDTVQHAREAAARLNATDRVVVLDSGLASIGLAEAALRASAALQRGESLESAVQSAELTRSQINVEFTVSSLKYLRQSQRITRAQEMMGNMLSLRPVLTFQQGRLVPVRRVKV